MGSIISSSPEREDFRGFKNKNLLISLWLPKQLFVSHLLPNSSGFLSKRRASSSVPKALDYLQSMIYLYLSEEADSHRSKSSTSSRFPWPTSSKGCPGAGNLHHSNRDLREQECSGKGYGMYRDYRGWGIQGNHSIPTPQGHPPSQCGFCDFLSLFPVWFSLAIRIGPSTLHLDTIAHFIEQYICSRRGYITLCYYRHFVIIKFIPFFV